MYEMEATMTMNAGAFAPTTESFARIEWVCVCGFFFFCRFVFEFAWIIYQTKQHFAA